MQAGAGRAVTEPTQLQSEDKEAGGRGQVAVWSAAGVTWHLIAIDAAAAGRNLVVGASCKISPTAPNLAAFLPKARLGQIAAQQSALSSHLIQCAA